jgi:ABC-2 type transport system permease protein
VRLSHVWHLGIKEFYSLLRDPVMLILIIYVFSFSVYSRAKAIPDTLTKAPIAIIDEDRSPLSARIAAAFYPPYFLPPEYIGQLQMDARMDAGLDTFALDIPPDFQRDVLADRAPTIQLNVDATRMSQAFTGSGYVQTIVNDEIRAFVQRYRDVPRPPADVAVRVRFNQNLKKSWFSTIMSIIENVTMLSIVLTGAALIREREHGTIEHLLVMPVTPLEIMLSKVWSMGLVVVAAATASLLGVVHAWLDVPIEGSVALFVAATSVHLFATTSLGIFLATIARSMPQFGLLLMLVLQPLQMLSGATTPRESMPEIVQVLMLAAPNTHFVMLAQGILYRGAGFSLLWPQFLALAAIGGILFGLALARFRRTIAAMA